MDFFSHAKVCFVVCLVSCAVGTLVITGVMATGI